ncbi:MAG: hypothetical protein MSA89_14970 [Clostridium sp.]|nr:hypothetical protein [Clostridium sp.]MCI7444356.1 hypothetical protein [Clostridium sp.]
MYKKLNNKEWEEAVNLYYKENNDITIKEYCTINNLNKSQFYYHKKRISNNKNKGLIFQAIQLNDRKKIINENVSSNSLLEIKISIRATKIFIPVSETTLINSIIKDLILNV